GRLLLQRLPQIIRALAELAEQPGVFDSNDGLVGETLDQLDLLVREWTDLMSVDGDGPDEVSLLEHRHAKQSSCARAFNDQHSRMPIKVGLFRPDVTNVHYLFSLSYPAEGDARIIENKGFPPQQFDKSGRCTVRRNGAKGGPFAKE